MEQELVALRDRLAKEKAAMDELRQRNEALTAQLQQAATSDPLETSHSPSDADMPDSAASTASAAASSKITTSVEVIYMPKDKKMLLFSGDPGTVSYYDWVDEVQNFMTYRQYKEREQAAFLYDHLEGGAKQEIRYSSAEIRRSPALILEALKEAYGHPYSLTASQKRFFDRKQKAGEGLREFSHSLLSLAGDINRCNGGVELCGEQTIRNQFAENVRDSSLRRELKRLIRQDPNIKFSVLRREAMLFWEEDNVPDRVSCGLAPESAIVECAGIATTTSTPVNPDPLLLELRDAMRKQEEKLEGLVQQVSRLQNLEGRRGRRLRQEPRYDANGRPICFRCQGIGHIARFCSDTNIISDNGRQAAPSEVPRGAVAPVNVQQGN
ncbi:uncharacterized protein [Misgurnus anguillicaudatus]|uniref:uncharacterized protein isoform X2 n=1 Tax=Misgurnus anguillicaudatus TaxID=75329 RepID=UPI003CCF7B91